MYTSMQQRGTLYHDLKYLLDAIVSESFGVNVPPTGDYVVKIGQNSLDFYSNDVWDETREISNNYSFFHYDLEFLDVFYDNAGKLKKNPGFDAVVGNPPYGASLSDSEKSYLRKKFQINTTDTAQLMMVAGKRLTKHKGQHSFIVPKAMIHASNWGSIRNHFLKSLQTLVDVGKVWKNVLLEQSIYVIKNGVEFPSYRNGVRENDQIVVDTVIDKKFLKLFGFYLSGITNSDLNLAKKLCQNEMLDKYIINTRGASYQKHSEDKVGLPVLGGRQIRQYYLDGVYGYIDSAKAKDKNAYVTTDSILVQNLITHVLNPVDYIKIISTIPSDTNFVILDSVNQLTMTDKSVSPYYILGLINSKIIRWYAYRFILGKSIRTMHFDNPVTKKFPVVVKNDIQIIDLVKKILKLTNEAYVAKKAPNSNLELDSNKKILVELKIKLNKLFYDNFNLNDEEIQLVESSMPE